MSQVWGVSNTTYTGIHWCIRVMRMYVQYKVYMCSTQFSESYVYTRPFSKRVPMSSREAVRAAERPSVRAKMGREEVETTGLCLVRSNIDVPDHRGTRDPPEQLLLRRDDQSVTLSYACEPHSVYSYCTCNYSGYLESQLVKPQSPKLEFVSRVVDLAAGHSAHH